MTKLPEGDLSVSLRPVSEADEDFLFEVYASTRADEMALVDWNEQQKKAFLQMQSDAQRRSYEEEFSGAEYDIILLGERPVGRFWVHRTPDEIHLLDIALLPEYQNRGIGSVLLGRLIDESEETGKVLRHTVFKLNTEAFRFYERLGFSATKEIHMYVYMERLPAGFSNRSETGG